MMGNILSNVNKEGCFTNLSLSSVELTILRKIINEHYLNILKNENINNFDTFKKNGIKNYHKLSHLLDHPNVWHKKNRILKLKDVNIIKSMGFFKILQKEFGNFDISNEEQIEKEELYFRICRPNEASDFGPLHADSWFWELGLGELPENKQGIKVWIAIYVEKGLNGLRYVPKSHTKNFPYHGVQKDGFKAPKPQIDISEENLDIKLFNSDPGDMIVFHDNLIHGGAENKGKYTRVSLEFAILKDKNE